MKMNIHHMITAVTGMLLVLLQGCVDQEDLIYADPDYNGPGELLECENHIPCPQVCRFYVAGSGATTANGLSWNTALRYIQPAINKASCAIESCAAINSCDVWVAGLPKYDDTTRVENIRPPHDYSMAANNRDRLDTLRVRDNINLYGGFAGTESTPDDRWFVRERPNSLLHVQANMSLSHFSGGNNRTMEVEGRARVDGFFFDDILLSANEWGPVEGGAAIWAHGASTTIANCVFTSTGGTGLTGGAVLITGGNGTISYSVFSDNQGMNGGALAVTGGSTTINHSIFHDNMAFRYGGAIYREDAIDLEIQNSILSDNYADWGGGAVKVTASGEAGQYPLNQSLTVENSLFLANIADTGSAIDAQVFQDTTAVHTIRNSVFLNNRDTVRSETLTFNDSTTSITNSIIWTDATGTDPVVVGVDEINHSVIQNWTEGTGNIPDDPMITLVPIVSFTGTIYTYTLDPASPCIDAGNGDAAPATDMAGNPRVDVPEIPNTGMGAAPFSDIGAIEAGIPAAIGTGDNVSLK
jgi:hypothetical protein